MWANSRHLEAYSSSNFAFILKQWVRISERILSNDIDLHLEDPDSCSFDKGLYCQVTLDEIGSLLRDSKLTMLMSTVTL